MDNDISGMLKVVSIHCNNQHVCLKYKTSLILFQNTKNVRFWACMNFVPSEFTINSWKKVRKKELSILFIRFLSSLKIIFIDFCKHSNYLTVLRVSFIKKN